MVKKIIKSGQMKIQQTAFLLLAVTLLFVIVGVLVVGLKISGLKKTAIGLEEKNAVLLVSKLANSPEFSCGNAYGINRLNCVDADKAMMLGENLTRYRRFWGVKNIEIRKIYPKIQGNVECSRTNYPECNLIRAWPRVEGTNYTLVDNFVSLCRKEPKNNWAWDKCEMAILMIDYVKEEW